MQKLPRLSTNDPIHSTIAADYSAELWAAVLQWKSEEDCSVLLERDTWQMESQRVYSRQERVPHGTATTIYGRIQGTRCT